MDLITLALSKKFTSDAIDEAKVDKTDIVQSNYNQNDETALDYIKNRPFYDTGGFKWADLVINPSLETTVFGYCYIVKPGASFTLDKEYKVVIDDKEYICSPRYMEYSDSFSGIAIGAEISGGLLLLPSTFKDESIPFHIVNSSETNLIAVFPNNQAPTNLQIYVKQADMKLLDRKFIDYIPGERVSGKEVIYNDTKKICGNGAEVFNNLESNIATGNYSHAEGIDTVAEGEGAHAEGVGNIANGSGTHAEGHYTKAGNFAHSEGHMTSATGQGTHAEGTSTIASGMWSHAEGGYTEARGYHSHAEGYGTIAATINSHVQGMYNEIDTEQENKPIYGEVSLAGGNINSATFDLDKIIYIITNPSLNCQTGLFNADSFTEITAKDLKINDIFVLNNTNDFEIYYTVTSLENNDEKIKISQDVHGSSIAASLGKYVHIIGNGFGNKARSNAHTLDWNGNAEFAGDVKVNACGGEKPISLIALSEDVADLKESGTGGSVAVDDALSETSTNPVQNKVVTKEIRQLSEEIVDLKKYYMDNIVREYTIEPINATKNDGNYFFLNGITLKANTTYCFEFKASEDVTTSVKLSSSDTIASVVHELFTTRDFANGEVVRELYTPTVDTIKYIRVDSRDILLSMSAVVYQIDMEKVNKSIQAVNDRVDETVDVAKQNAMKTYNNESTLIATKKYIDDAIDVLQNIKVGESTEKEITLNVGTHERCMVRVGLHYGESKYTPQADDIFFEGKCKTDFSDIRFFDSNGNMLKAEFGKPVNLDLLADTRINGRITKGGKIIKFSDTTGIYISRDNGDTFTVISGTANVTSNGSDVYGYKSMYPIYADENDNIYAYAGGKLYKLLNSDDYATKTEVCDFTWIDSDGKTVYPDIQSHAMDMDKNGIMYFGIYQSTKYYHVDIYKSVNNGASWSKCYTKDGDVAYQHVHHIHSDKFTGKTYVGIDSSVSSPLGSKIIVTSDGGTSWDDITSQIMNSENPAIMKDYYPTYFGNGYRLGGGETYINGRATIYRSTDDINLVSAVKGVAGVRSFADFGNDDVILCGSSQSEGVAENHIFISTDKGITWDSIYKKYQNHSYNSGIGFRESYNAVTLMGDTEPCVVITADQGNVPTFRVYSGGNHYYREAYILLENTTGNVTIKAKSGFLMEYPYKSIEESREKNLIYNIPFSEGKGKYVHDSRGNICEINGNDYSWDSEEVVRFGDYSGESTIRPYAPNYGLRLRQGTTLNFGKFADMKFSRNYSISMWIKTDGVYTSDFYKLFSIGNTCVYQRSINFGIIDNDAEIISADISNALHSSMMVNGTFRKSNQDYYHLVLTVDDDYVCRAYLNGVLGSDRNDASPSGKIFLEFKDRDLIIGSEDNNGAFYISDIRIYDKPLSSDEVMKMYRGW